MADANAAFAVTLEDHVTPNARKAAASVDKLSSSLKGSAGGLQLKGLDSLVAIPHQLQGVFDGLERGASGGAVALGLLAGAAFVAKAALTGLVDITEKLIHFTLEAANENQHQIATFDALGLAGQESGKKTLAMLDEVGSKLPQSEAQLVSWTKQIQAAGVTDLSKVRSELIAVASAQAIMGDEGAAAYQKIQTRVRLAVEGHHGLALAEKSLTALYKAGVNQADVAKRMGMTTEELSSKLKAGTLDAAKFGDALRSAVTEKGKGPLDVMMNSLTSMGHKLQKSLGDLFEETDTKPLTDALRNLLALFEDGTPSADGMKMGITGAMNAVIRMLGKGITEAEIFFLRMEVLGLQAYVALKPLISAVGQIASAFGAASGALGGAVGGAVNATSQKTGVDAGAMREQGMSAGSLMVTGLTGGLTLWPTVIMDVLSSIGNAKAQEVARQGGVDVGKATLEGIREGVEAHSPSIAAMKIGMDVGAGLGQGMEDSPAPARAARTISGNALGGLAGGGVFGGAPANDTGGVTIGQITVEITAPNGVTGAQELSVIGLATALERFQIGSGR